MYIEEALVSHIKNNGVNKIYPLKLPQKPVFPAVTYQKIAGEWQHSMGGDSGFAYTDYQFVCYAKTYNEAKDTARILRLLLQNLSAIINGIHIQAVLIENEFEDFEDETELYSILLEFRIFYTDKI